MAASVKDFLGQLQGGGYRPNRYRVNISFAPAVGNGPSEKISFTCKAASIPACNIGVAEVAYMGRMVKIPGDKTWDDWNVTVYIDTDLAGRQSFEQWQDRMLAFERNVASSNTVSQFFGRAEITLLDRTDSPLDIYEVDNMFPISVGELTLGFDQNDQVAEQQVTFAINGWKSKVTS